MTNDERKMLECAAKASGMHVIDDGERLANPHPIYEEMPGTTWNPLTNDADAFRLMVDLRLGVKFLSGFKQVVCHRNEDSDNFEIQGIVGYGDGADKCPAPRNVRRAITLAAARMGGYEG